MLFKGVAPLYCIYSTTKFGDIVIVDCYRSSLPIKIDEHVSMRHRKHIYFSNIIQSVR